MTNPLIARLLEKAHQIPQTTYLTFTVIHPTDCRKAVPSRHIDTSDTQQIGQTLQLIHQTNEMGWGAYVGIAYRKSRLLRYQRGGKRDLLALAAIFADVDRSPQDVLPQVQTILTPSMILSSGSGTHLYWFLKEPTRQIQKAERIIKGMALWLNGDKTMSSDQIMRLPNTINTKPQRQQAMCKVLSINRYEYELEDFFPYEILTTPLKQSPSLTKYRKIHSSQKSSHNQQLNIELAEVVLRELEKRYSAAPKGDGWYACYCPFPHKKDRFPGDHAYFRPDIGLFNCFGKHGQHLLHSLASQLSIDMNAWGGIYQSE